MSIEPTNIFEPYYVQGIMLDIAEKKILEMDSVPQKDLFIWQVIKYILCKLEVFKGTHLGKVHARLGNGTT